MVLRILKMHKRLSISIISVIIYAFACFLFFVLAMIALGMEIYDLTEERGAGILAFLFCFGMVFLFLWMLNRDACFVSFEDGKVRRRGFFGGFYREVSVDSIQGVYVAWLARGDGKFIVLADNELKADFVYPRFRLRKENYISFRKTKKNMEFLRSFWSGEIEEKSFFKIIDYKKE